jgi:hypothetical protein
MSRDDTQEGWSRKVAELAVDGLVGKGLVRKADFVQAVEVVAEEVFVRLCLHDFPPSDPDEASSNDA